jgi:hypothetical protein
VLLALALLLLLLLLSLLQNAQTDSGANPVSGLIGTGDIATGA